jgi:hypothetical protein
MTRILVGNVPDVHELYGRDEFISGVWRTLEADNVLLLAPRRFGKTGVMRHLVKQPTDGFLPVYLDVEDVYEPADFVWRVAKELFANERLRSILRVAKGLPRAIQRWFAETFDELEFEGAKVKFKDAISDSWQIAAKRLIVEMNNCDFTVVFIFDEFPAMLDNLCCASPDPAREILSWFRAIRLQQKQQLRRFRFVVGGSTGIDLVVRRLDVGEKLNDFKRMYLPPLEMKDAFKLATDLATTNEIGVDEKAIGRILKHIGPPVPYFIHVFFAQLGQLSPRQRERVTINTVDRVYVERILGPTCKQYFGHYEQRLGRHGDGRRRAARAILTTVANANGGCIRSRELYNVARNAWKQEFDEEVFNDLLADLECDWYLKRDSKTDEYGFMLDVMRDWWKRWHVNQPKS